MIRHLLAGGALMAALAAPAGASTGPAANPFPDPSCSTIPAMVTVTPDGSAAYTVRIVVCGRGPVSGAYVELEFSSEADSLISWAPGQDHPLLLAVADANGEATFHVAAGGCLDPATWGGGSFIAQVRADGVLMAEVGVNSPDAVNAQGLTPTDSGRTTCDDGIFQVSLADAVFHARNI